MTDVKDVRIFATYLGVSTLLLFSIWDFAEPHGVVGTGSDS